MCSPCSSKGERRKTRRTLPLKKQAWLVSLTLMVSPSALDLATLLRTWEQAAFIRPFSTPPTARPHSGGETHSLSSLSLQASSTVSWPPREPSLTRGATLPVRGLGTLAARTVRTLRTQNSLRIKRFCHVNPQVWTLPPQAISSDTGPFPGHSFPGAVSWATLEVGARTLRPWRRRRTP